MSVRNRLRRCQSCEKEATAGSSPLILFLQSKAAAHLGCFGSGATRPRDPVAFCHVTAALCVAEAMSAALYILLVSLSFNICKRGLSPLLFSEVGSKLALHHLEKVARS